DVPDACVPVETGGDDAPPVGAEGAARHKLRGAENWQRTAALDVPDPQRSVVDHGCDKPPVATERDLPDKASQESAAAPSGLGVPDARLPVPVAGDHEPAVRAEDGARALLPCAAREHMQALAAASTPQSGGPVLARGDDEPAVGAEDSAGHPAGVTTQDMNA